MTKAVIYARLSNESEKSTSIKRQVKECVDFANFKGMTVVGQFIDEGISGYSGKTRPEYEKVMAGLKTGEFDTVIVWKLDRLTRRGIAQIGRVLEVLDECGGRLCSVTENIDTNDNTGLMMIAILSEMARSESANTSLRIKAQKREAREAGKWLSGGNVPWAYVLTDEFKLAKDPELAFVARQVVDRVLAGESIRSITIWLTESGIPTPSGKSTWARVTLIRWLESPAVAGLQVTHEDGRTLLYRSPDTGQPVSVGEGYATEAEWRRMAELRASRRPHGRTKRGAARAQTTLGGLVFCGLCGGRMSRNSGTQWRCNALVDQGSCQGLGVNRVRFEGHVEAMMLNRITSLDYDSRDIVRVAEAWRGEVGPAEVSNIDESHLADLEARLDSLFEDRYKRNRFAGREEMFDRYFDDLTGEIDQFKATLKSMPSTDPRQHFVDFSDPEIVRLAWDNATIADRRAVAGALIDKVTVAPSTARKWQPERIEVVWRD